MAGRRQARLNEQIKRELTSLLQFEVRDPRIGIITITDVEVTPDLYHAKIYYNVRGDAEARGRGQEGLEAAAGFLRTELGKRMHIRRAPELHFHFDETLAHAMHIEQLLREVRDASVTEPETDTQPNVEDDEE